MTLGALLDCSRGVCADSRTLNEVLFALISGAVLVLLSFVLAVVTVLEDDNGSPARTGSP